MKKREKLKNAHIHSDEDAVAHMLMNAAGNKEIPDLTVEIISSAMRFLKQNPTETVAQACTFGINEWIK